MFKATCIEKIRDKNNHIIGYKIIGDDKKPIPVKSEKLKEVIRSGQLEVINLTLTSDNRLIDKKHDTVSKPTTTSSSKQNINIESVINKAKSMGYTFNTFDTACGHKCHIASSQDNTKHILIIPYDVKHIYDKNVGNVDIDIYDKDIYNHMHMLKGALKVIGGKNLISTQYMFLNCQVQSLDLRSLDTSNVTDMRFMFTKCEAQSINLTSFNTSKVKGMTGMFYECKAQSLDLRSFNTSNVTDMCRMFNCCRARSIDLSSFNTSNVTDMCRMFNCCRARSIDLSSFNTSNATNMTWMFNGCWARSLDLTSFNTSNIIDTSFMFAGCGAQIKVNDSELKYQLIKDRGIKCYV